MTYRPWRTILVPVLISVSPSVVSDPCLIALTDAFLRLQSHNLFDEHFCLVRKANEKGHVENLVGYTRRNFLVPLPSVRSFDELNDQLDQGCRAELDRRVRGKDGTKGHRLQEERSHLRGLPRDAFAACRVELRRANTLSLVRFDRNDYSVPVAWAHHKLTIIGDCRHVRVMCKDERIAEHPRDWGREHQISAQAFHRWKREFGMLEVDQAKQLKDLKKENERLKRMLADEMLGNSPLTQGGWAWMHQAMRDATDFFDGLEDPRVVGRCDHHLIDIVMIALVATMGDTDDWEDIAMFGRLHHDWFAAFLELPHGIPSPDTFARVFARLDPAQMNACFERWVTHLYALVHPESAGCKTIAIDGKTLRGIKKARDSTDQKPLHLFRVNR